MDPTGRQRLVLSLHTALTRCRDGISERGFKPPRQPTRPWLGSESRTSLCWEKEGQTQAAENTSRRPFVNIYAPCLCFMKEAETQSSVYQYRYSHHRPRARGYEVFRWMVCYNKLLINTKCTFLSKMITNWTLNLLAHNFLQSSYNQDLSQHLNCIGLQLCFVGDYLYLIWTHWLLIRIPVWFHNAHCFNADCRIM